MALQWDCAGSCLEWRSAAADITDVVEPYRAFAEALIVKETASTKYQTPLSADHHSIEN